MRHDRRGAEGGGYMMVMSINVKSNESLQLLNHPPLYPASINPPT